MKTLTLQQRANAIAEKFGMNIATEVVEGPRAEVIYYRQPGYYKNSNGQKVSKACFNVAWSLCHYEHAVCVVSLPAIYGVRGPTD